DSSSAHPACSHGQGDIRPLHDKANPVRRPLLLPVRQPYAGKIPASCQDLFVLLPYIPGTEIAGNNSSPPVGGLRMKTRRQLLPLPALVFVCAWWSSATLSGATFTVNDKADATDAHPGDGICATLTGTCTLRAAIQEANALAGTDQIVLPAGTYTLTIT